MGSIPTYHPSPWNRHHLDIFISISICARPLHCAQYFHILFVATESLMDSLTATQKYDIDDE